jgi:lipid-A-disaccharide synthase
MTADRMQTIYFVAGEASADNHGAGLMRALRQLEPNLRFTGRGGPQMKAIAGDQFDNWIDQAGVLGLWEVIKQYGYFRKQFRASLRQIENTKPDAVVLIDYPGFNLRLARALRKKSPACKIIYYISPQVWAWNRRRIKKMARWIDLMLCIFPFEAELYNKSGLHTIFVGHPMVERLGSFKTSVSRDPNLVGFFPGSRTREIRKILPILIETARGLVRQKPNLRFEIAAASAEIAGEINAIIERTTPHLNPLLSTSGEADAERRVRGVAHVIDVKVGETTEIMQRAFAGIVASGSATLEAAFFRLPFVLVYKVSWLTYVVGRILVKIKHIGMPNVLAGKEIVPEFLQYDARPKKLADALMRVIDDPAGRTKMVSEFDVIINSLGGAGASEHAARAVVEALHSA